VTAKVERQTEIATDIVEPLDESGGDLTLQERMVDPLPGSPLAPPAQRRAIENEQGIECHRLYVGRKRSAG
jgi:hypothetical protein